MTSLDQRVLGSAIGALELFGIYLGDRLGLYAARQYRGMAGLAGAAGTPR